MMQDSAQKQIRAFVERIERIEEEIKAGGQDRKDVYAEAKAVGFDVKILRKIIARRKKSQQAVQEEEELLRVYLNALDGTPIGAFLKETEDA